MCGICGIVKKQGSGRDIAYVNVLQNMLFALKERGPDKEGKWVSGDNSLFLGHRRLSIIDLSDSASQPMFNEDNTICLIQNGEIYNYKGLRSDLIQRGHIFRSQSDSEVILHSYEEYGIECVKKLRGMFAFALWDSNCKKLFLVRDRLGIKPLYYCAKDEVFIFSSLVKSILNSGIVSREIDKVGFLSYLSFGAISEPNTIIKGIKMLPPGSILIFDKGSFKVEHFWRLRDYLGNKKYNNAAKGDIRSLLEESINLRLMSDVPIGVFLSGGVDSSAITALASRASASRIKTFSIVFEDRQCDESMYSDLVARKFNTEHHKILITYKEVLNNIKEAILAMDQPTINGINTYFISRAAKESGMTVALSGLGGDELFCGYPSFNMTSIIDLLRSLPKGLKYTVDKIGNLILSKRRYERLNYILKDNTFIFHPYFANRILFYPSMIENMVNDFSREDLLNCILSSYLTEPKNMDRDVVNEVSSLEIQYYLRNMLLRDSDFMSMAHSLEIRVPFLDHSLVEYLLAIRGKSKISKNVSKILLADAVKDLLPDNVIHRRKKGFEFPFASWLRNEIKEDILNELMAGNTFFYPGYLQELWNKFLSGEYRWERPWSIFVLLNWLRINKIHL